MVPLALIPAICDTVSPVGIAYEVTTFVEDLRKIGWVEEGWNPTTVPELLIPKKVVDSPETTVMPVVSKASVPPVPETGRGAVPFKLYPTYFPLAFTSVITVAPDPLGSGNVELEPPNV